MATNQNAMQETAGKMTLGRTLVLASLGAFGIASDHVNRILQLDTLLQLFVRRGERVEKSALALIRRER